MNHIQCTKFKRWHRRLLMLLCSVSFIAVACLLAFKTFNENMMLFVTPTDVMSGNIKNPSNLRLGGMVKSESIKHDHNDVMEFILTDFTHEVKVYYKGVVPSLFREGSGTVVRGRLKDSTFYAEELLAKHDENYMPREVAEALKKSSASKE